MVVTTFSVPPTTKSGSIPKDLHHNMRLLLRRYPLLLMKVQWLCVFWMSGVSPNHCLKTLQTCSPQGCNAEVHGDLCMSAKCCSVCIQAGTYTGVASMQMSSLSALTLIFAYSASNSLELSGSSKSEWPGAFFGIRARLIFNSSNSFSKCFGWLCMASWFGLTIICFRFKKVSSPPSLQTRSNDILYLARELAPKTHSDRSL